MTLRDEEKIAVVGLGYVGLPAALAFAQRFPTVGYDVRESRIAELRSGRDETGSAQPAELAQTALTLASDVQDLAASTFFVITVPASIHSDQRFDAGPLLRASERVGSVLRPGAVVVFESTVPPGTTQMLCAPALERASGLVRGRDFGLAYSPERINPGDPDHSFAQVRKVVAAEDAATLERVAATYAAVLSAGVVRAPSIAVAEAAKVIENAQRDVNIALMNEASRIFAPLGLRTRDVLRVAATKWNFAPFEPGLVGGDCLGLGSLCLAHAARDNDLAPELLSAARRINDSVSQRVAKQTLQLLAQSGTTPADARVGICGCTFKEDLPDLRNSRVPEIDAQLRRAGVRPLVHDPVCSAERAQADCGLELCSWSDLVELDALVCAVPHSFYRALPPEEICGRVRDGGAIIDVRSMLDPAAAGGRIRYWSL